MALAARHLSADEYLALGDQLPRFTELIDGQVVVSSPSIQHQHVVVEIMRALRLWIASGPARGQGGIPVDFRVDGDNVYAGPTPRALRSTSRSISPATTTCSRPGSQISVCH